MLLAFFPLLLFAQSLADGVARLQSNDFAGAAKILEAVTEREPDNFRAWGNLALAYERLKDIDRAIGAYQHVLAARPGVAQPMYNIARLYAAKQDTARSIEWLTKARETHKIDLTQVEGAPEFASLKNDPRVRALLPRPADFEQPF